MISEQSRIRHKAQTQAPVGRRPAPIALATANPNAASGGRTFPLARDPSPGPATGATSGSILPVFGAPFTAAENMAGSCCSSTQARRAAPANLRRRQGADILDDTARPTLAVLGDGGSGGWRKGRRRKKRPIGEGGAWGRAEAEKVGGAI